MKRYTLYEGKLILNPMGNIIMYEDYLDEMIETHEKYNVILTGLERTAEDIYFKFGNNKEFERDDSQ